MKKFLACILCMLIVCAIPFALSAEEIPTDEESVAIETTVTPTETTVTPTETTAESVIQAPAEIPEEYEDQNETGGLLSDKFEEWILPHFEEISVIITLILTAFYNMRKHKLLNKSIGTMNNNTIAIAQNNSDMMSQAMSNISNTANIVTAYDARIAAMLEAHKSNAEDKERLERELLEIKAYLKTAAQANIEFSNELAELLNLANIPNFKKEEIGARHLAAVNSIKAAESEALSPMEVAYDGKEA